MAGVTSAQLRKHLTPTGYYGSPMHGYGIKQLMDSISEIIAGLLSGQASQIADFCWI